VRITALFEPRSEPAGLHALDAPSLLLRMDVTSPAGRRDARADPVLELLAVRDGRLAPEQICAVHEGAEEPDARHHGRVPGPGGRKRVTGDAAGTSMGMLSPVEREALGAQARAALEHGWREGTTRGGVRYAYTRPASRYPEQFFWDSCFHAIAWSRLEPARARAELRSLVAAQRPDGHIGHTIFWPGRVRATRAHIYNVLSRGDAATWSIQPPLLGWAWAEVAARSPDDPGFAAEGVAPVAAFHDWLERERADPDGLIGILQPDESGMDASPAYDGPLGLRAHPRPGFLILVRFNRRRGYRYREIVADGGFHAIDPLVNAALAMSWASLGRLGHPDGARRAARLTAAMVDRLWDPARGLFFAEGPDGRPLRVSTWASLAPLALEDLPAEIGRRLIDEHLLDPARYWLPYPVPSTAADERAFRAGRIGRIAPRYWRGPTWLFSTLPLLIGLARAGRPESARELALRTARLVARSGMREYYNPYTGEGLGAGPFATSAIALDALLRVDGLP
jgi:hypothetical protein